MRLVGEIVGYVCIAIVAIEAAVLSVGLATGALDWQRLAQGASVAAGWDSQAEQTLAVVVDAPHGEAQGPVASPVAAELPPAGEPARR